MDLGAGALFGRRFGKRNPIGLCAQHFERARGDFGTSLLTEVLDFGRTHSLRKPGRRDRRQHSEPVDATHDLPSRFFKLR
jgi:hypothetical protein